MLQDLGFHRAFPWAATALLSATWLGSLSAGCSDGDDGKAKGAGGAGIVLPGAGNSSVPNAGSGPYKLPDGYTKSELGGFKLGDPFDGDKPPNSATMGNNSDCSAILAVVRDFNAESGTNPHADFEKFAGQAATKGLVAPTLTDQKPVYTGRCELGKLDPSCPYEAQTSGKAAFDQWYRYTANVNKPYTLYLSLEPHKGMLVFQSHSYFPLDGTGLGNQGRSHNYHFTTEIHTQFEYRGGETFLFIGDDDVWVFMNNKLALDLGGLHPEANGSVVLDQRADDLGLTKGKLYSLDLFHAERHTHDSNFRVETNLRFTNCGVIVPEPPPR